MTPCCGQDVDRDILNVNDEEDWKQIENHIESYLRDYKNVESVTPISCKDCGRLLEYIVILKRDRTLPGD